MGRFRMITTFEGVETGDRRMIRDQALTTRAVPHTLMAMLRNPDGGWGHAGAEIAGRTDTLTRVDASTMVDEATGQTWGEIAGGPVSAWIGEGEFTDDEHGRRTEQLVRDRVLRGVSVDLTAVDSELEVLEEDEDGWPIDWLDTVTAGEIAAATVCNIPAFRGCTIEVIDDDTNTGEDDGEPVDTSEEAAAIAASADPWLPAFRVVNDGPGCEPCATSAQAGLAAVTASGGPLHPPAGWFTDPGLDGPTPLTIDDDGHVYGHLALWSSCHTGMQGQCVTPPRSSVDYAMFRTGALRTAEGTDVAVGRITLGTGHADLRASAAAAAEHYDHTGTAVADVDAGEDEHGIWVAGALRPDVTDEEVRALRASPLSGDWRRHGNGLELVAALAVNVAGFNIPRPRSVAASGVQQSLVAAGALAVQRAAEKGPAVAPRDRRALTDVMEELRKVRLELAAERQLRRIRRQRP